MVKRMKLNIQMFAMSGTFEGAYSGTLKSRIQWSATNNGNRTWNCTGILQGYRNSSTATEGNYWNRRITVADQTYEGMPNERHELKNVWQTFQTITKSNGQYDVDGNASVWLYGWINGPSGTSLSGNRAYVEDTVSLDNIGSVRPTAGITTIHDIDISSVVVSSIMDDKGQTIESRKYEISSDGGLTYDSLSVSGFSNIEITELLPETSYKIRPYLQTKYIDNNLYEIRGEWTDFTTLVDKWVTLVYSNSDIHKVTMWLIKESGNTKIVKGKRKIIT